MNFYIVWEKYKMKRLISNGKTFSIGGSMFTHTIQMVYMGATLVNRNACRPPPAGKKNCRKHRNWSAMHKGIKRIPFPQRYEMKWKDNHTKLCKPTKKGNVHISFFFFTLQWHTQLYFIFLPILSKCCKCVQFVWYYIPNERIK